MRRVGIKPGCVLALGVLAAVGTAKAVTYGLKSKAPPSPSPSQAPTHLFRFAENGSGLTDLGPVRLNGADIDADGLAISPAYGLLGYRLTATGSTLIRINPVTGAASTIGGELAGREIRGAVFDLSDALWVVDVAGDVLLRIDPLSGAQIGTAVPLTLGSSPHNLTTVTDIAVRANGTYYITDWEASASNPPGYARIYTVNVSTGQMVLVHSDHWQALVGASFSMAAGDDDLFALEVNNESIPGVPDNDDILRYDVDSGFSRVFLYGSILPIYNAGRGDLAAVIIPEPLTLAGVLLGVGAVWHCLLKRRGG